MFVNARNWFFLIREDPIVGIQIYDNILIISLQAIVIFFLKHNFFYICFKISNKE